MYKFLPYQSVHKPVAQSYYFDDCFTKEEIKEIIKLGENTDAEQAGIDEGQIEKKQRDSNISWINSHEGWLANRMGWIAVQLNKDAFNFDLTGFHEHFQYTIYDSKNGEQHYDWHIDIGTGTELPRKLSLIVLLSDPKDYKGADLQINTGNITTLEPKFGRVYAFPSYILHRVTPIESGIRKSLVSWISGPDFR